MAIDYNIKDDVRLFRSFRFIYILMLITGKAKLQIWWRDGDVI